MWPRLLILLCALGLGALAPGAAQDVPSGEQTPIGEVDTSSPGNDRVALVSTWDFVRMILILAAVVATIYVVFVVVRRTGRRGVVENDMIAVLGSRTLSGSRGLHLVRVGKSVYLVGSSETSVSLVSEIQDKESVDELLLAASRQPAAGKRTFSEVLSGLLPQKGGKLVMPEGLGFLKRQRARLRSMGGG